jgi:uncharacterized DUF497 family protein
VQFEWDEQKNQANIHKHGLRFEHAPDIFASPMLTIYDGREDYGEDRWIGIGLLGGRIVVIVFTERGADVVRVISLRKAQRHERNAYEQTFRDRLGSN